MTIPNQDMSPNVTTGPLPASRKIYVAGSLHPEIRVPMREISTHPTAGEAPLPLYDSSGPYTDPAAVIDVAGVGYLVYLAATTREAPTMSSSRSTLTTPKPLGISPPHGSPGSPKSNPGTPPMQAFMPRLGTKLVL